MTGSEIFISIPSTFSRSSETQDTQVRCLCLERSDAVKPFEKRVKALHVVGHFAGFLHLTGLQAVKKKKKGGCSCFTF